MAKTDELKVGELAARTGLTVRTLHHYDEIGLLRPSRRTASGHRLYGIREVERLQRIASLRQLGLSLEEVASCVDDPRLSLARVLEMQTQRLRQDIGRQTRLMSVLEALMVKLEEGAPLTLAEVTAAIEATVEVERHYTPEQLERLAGRAKAMGPEGLRRAQEAWQDVFRGMADAHGSGLPPDSGPVLALAREARSLIRAFTGGDPGLRASLQRLYAGGSGGGAMRGHGMAVAPEVMDFYARAMNALEALEPEE